MPKIENNYNPNLTQDKLMQRMKVFSDKLASNLINLAIHWTGIFLKLFRYGYINIKGMGKRGKMKRALVLLVGLFLTAGSSVLADSGQKIQGIWYGPLDMSFTFKKDGNVFFKTPTDDQTNYQWSTSKEEPTTIIISDDGDEIMQIRVLENELIIGQSGNQLIFAKSKEEAEAKNPGIKEKLKAAKNRAKGIMNVNKLRQIGVAMMMYSVDHNDKYPDSLTLLAPAYIEKETLYNNSGELFKLSYDAISSKDKDSTEIVLIIDTSVPPYKHSLYADGHVSSE